MIKEVLLEIEDAISELEADRVKRLVNDYLKKGIPPLDILSALRKGLEKVGQKFEEHKYFISELILAGEIMKNALTQLKPHIKTEKMQIKSRIVLGTAFGDLHDIGKEVVKTLLISVGFEVYDLGVDVHPQKFVDEARKMNANIIGVSALLSTTTPIAAEVVNELKKAGLRDKVKVIVGGAAVRDWMVKEYGVDAAVNDAVKGVNIIESWVGQA